MEARRLVVLDPDLRTCPGTRYQHHILHGHHESEHALITISKGSGVVDTWAISPALPNGLTFNTGNGAINGTPDAPLDRTTYTISATNSGGTDTIDVNLTFRDPTTVTVLKGFDDTASPNFGFEDRNGSSPGRVSGGPSGMAWQPNGTWLSDESIIGVSSRHACMVREWIRGLLGVPGEWTVGERTDQRDSEHLVVVDLPAGRTAIAVAVGSEAHSCALLGQSECGLLGVR